MDDARKPAENLQLSPATKAHFDEFMGLVHHRLAVGEREYGDASFDTDTFLVTLGECEEEVLDQAGWGFVAWVKLQVFKKLAADHLKEADKALRRAERGKDYWKTIATRLREEGKS